MTREYDPTEETLIHQAASDALAMINAGMDEPRVNKYVQSGNEMFHVHLSILTPAQAESATERCKAENREQHCWHETFRHDTGGRGMPNREIQASKKCCWCGISKSETFKGPFFDDLAKLAMEQKHGSHLPPPCMTGW